MFQRNGLKGAMIESSMANILMAIAGVVPVQEVPAAPFEDEVDTKKDVNKTLELLRMHVSAQVSDDEEMDADDQAMQIKERTPGASALEVKKILRRERNRMHAKKARLRKKKLIEEMEEVSMKIVVTIFNSMDNQSASVPH
jgi:hypothetical protein